MPNTPVNFLVTKLTCRGQLNEQLDLRVQAGRRKEMNWTRIEGNWKQFKGKIREGWGKLTDRKLDVIAGKRDQIIGKIQKKYGSAFERARKEMNKFRRKH